MSLCTIGTSAYWLISILFKIHVAIHPYLYHPVSIFDSNLHCINQITTLVFGLNGFRGGKFRFVGNPRNSSFVRFLLSICCIDIYSSSLAYFYIRQLVGNNICLRNKCFVSAILYNGLPGEVISFTSTYLFNTVPLSGL